MLQRLQASLSATTALRERLGGHARTITPTLRHGWLPRKAPRADFWRTQITNEEGRSIALSGMFADVAGATDLVVVLHGLGGAVDRGYCVEAARAAHRVGVPCLRLAMRGADGLGEDFHHAGLTADLGEVLAQPFFERFERVALLGYSMGGHVCLKAAAEGVSSKICAVAAVCPPLDLGAAQRCIDAPGNLVYRRHLLAALNEIYAGLAARGKVPTPVERVRQATSLREWDQLTVVPRFGFRDVDDYYESQSVGGRLTQLKVPALVVASPGDPMIPAQSLRGPLVAAADQVEARWVGGGGHVFFAPGVDLGFEAEPGVEAQVLAFLLGGGKGGA
ncbi:alpha/beta fold hydrolase [Lujinxingia litoralis]|nr:alpha/beta fold hydrolase [Lujinxingia litoralis]